MDSGDRGRDYMESPSWTWGNRLRHRLFPSKYCPLPNAPSNYKDGIHIRTVSVLSWLDRLRVVFTGKIVVETQTVTENEIGKNITSAVCYVEAPTKKEVAQ